MIDALDADSASGFCCLEMVSLVNGFQCEAWDAPVSAVVPDYSTLGALVLYTEGEASSWVDLIVSDVAAPGHAAERLAALAAELGAPLEELTAARKHVNRGHGLILGSSCYTIVRLIRKESR